jgi:hypothetical protein
MAPDGTFNYGSTFLFSWNGHWIIDTNHGWDRIKERSKLPIDKLKLLFQKALAQFDRGFYRNGQEILFFSNQLNQGFVGAVANNKNIRLITFLPPGRRTPMPGTAVALVESIDEADTYTGFKTLHPLTSDQIARFDRSMGLMKYQKGPHYMTYKINTKTVIRVHNEVLKNPKVHAMVKKFGVSIDTDLPTTTQVE